MSFVINCFHRYLPWLSLINILGTILSSLLLAVIFRWLWSRRHLYVLSWKLPGPVALPFIGNICPYTLTLKKALEALKKNSKSYSPYRLWLGTKLIVVITDPADIEAVLSESYIPFKPKMYYFWAQGIGCGLLTNRGGTTWRRVRYEMNSVLSDICLKSHQVTINQHCLRTVNALQPLCNNDTQDVTNYLYRLCSDIVVDCLFKEESSDFQNGKFDHVIKSIAEISTITHERLRNCRMQCKYMYENSESHKKLLMARKNVQNYASNLYKRKKAEYLESKKMKSGFQRLYENQNVTTPIDIMLEAQASAGRPFDIEIIEEMMNFLNAGTDPTASCLGFFLMMLAINPECEKQLYAEINEHFQGHPPEEVSLEDLAALPYLDMCHMEVMRLFPAVSFTIREAVEDVLIEEKNLVIPSGTMVMIPNYMLNTNPDYWKQPQNFNPERFTPENSAERHPYLFLPFGTGPRNCFGQTIGKQIVKTCIVHLVSRFYFFSRLTMEYVQVEAELTSLRSKKGFKVEIDHRK